jgi:molybdopterin molybdotransferase
MTELISVTEAQALIAAHMPSFGSEAVPLAEAAGRILRHPLYAEHDHPPFDRVMMDGIAVRWQASLPRSLTLAGTQLAGMAMQRWRRAMPASKSPPVPWFRWAAIA